MSEVYDLLIISAGRVGREIHGQLPDVVRAGARWRLKGFLDDRPDILDGFACSTPILASVEDYVPETNDRFICAVGDSRARRRYCDLITAKGGVFADFVHPTAVVAPTASLGNGVVIGPFVAVGADAIIGAFTMIGPHTFVGHDCVVGDWCDFGGHGCLGGNVRIDDSCFLGLGSTVIPGVSIGSRAFVGAGSLVLNNVAPGTKVFGNPAVVIGPVPERGDNG